MTDLRQQAGIRTDIWIAGKKFFRGPAPLQITPRRFEVKTRLSNLALSVDRVFVLEGMPNVRQRHEIALPWATLAEPGLLQHVDLVCAIGQPFDVGLWKQVYDVFDGDGITKAFYLQRRQLLAAVTPDVAYTDYPTQASRFDKPLTDPTATETVLTVVPKTSSNINTGDPASDECWVEDDGHLQGNLWLTTVRVGTAPANDHDVFLVKYLPRYLMVVDVEDPRSYGAAFQEPRGIRLVEFG